VKILGDSNITAASITATNIISSALTDKLKTFTLTDNLRTISNSTRLDITFDGTIPNIDTIALCGTNLTPSAVVTLTYADVDINSPDGTVVLPTFSTLHQVFFLDASINKKYLRINIVDTGLSTINIGYIYAGVAIDIPFVEFGHVPGLNIFSNSSVTATGQSYGSKIYNSLPVDFTMLINYDLLESYMEIKQEKQNIDRVLIVEYIDSYDLALYRPKYGVLVGEETPFPISENNLTYAVSDRLEERF